MSGRTEADEAVRDEAAAWLARLRAPSGAEDHAAFEAWYSADPRHAAAYDALLETWDQMALAARTPAARARSRGPGTAAAPWRSAMAAAAAILLVIAGVALYRATAFRPDAQPSEIASRVGDIRAVSLADGTRVTLDTDSAIATAYTAKERRVILERGRARFAVAHDASRRFVVEAGDRIVIAHGTVFDVELRAHETRVSLLRGSVEVRRRGPASAAAGHGRFLAPGQQLAIGGDAGPEAPRLLPPAEARWPSGMLAFDNARLADVVAAANRYSATRIVLPDGPLRERRFTGTMRARDTQGIARMLAETFALDVSHGPGPTLVLAERFPPPK